MGPPLVSGLWRDCTIQRSPCLPSCSGRQHSVHRNFPTSRRALRSVQTHISADASLGPSSPVVVLDRPPSASPTWSVEAMDDDAFLATPASMSSSKPLRINLDLRLVSSTAAAALAYGAFGLPHPTLQATTCHCNALAAVMCHKEICTM